VPSTHWVLEFPPPPPLGLEHRVEEYVSEQVFEVPAQVPSTQAAARYWAPSEQLQQLGAQSRSELHREPALLVPVNRVGRDGQLSLTCSEALSVEPF
jgi:hypothetical protein